jgi:hypothetical protein
MKKTFCITFMVLCSVLFTGCYEAGFDPNAPDFGLPKGNEVLIGLLIAVPSFLLGQVLVRKENETIGCIGSILHVVAVVGLIPILIWLCEIGRAIFAILFGIAIVGGIFYIIFGKK